MMGLLRRRMMMQEASEPVEVWKPIATTPMQFRTYGTGVSFNSSTGVLTFSKGSTSWGNYCKLINMPYKYSDLEGHTIRVSFDYTVTGNVGTYAGLVFVPNEYSDNTANSSRKAGISQNTTGLKTTTSASGTLTWSGVLSTDLLTYSPDNHSANNYFGVMIALNAGTSVSATMSNIVYEYLE